MSTVDFLEVAVLRAARVGDMVAINRLTARQGAAGLRDARERREMMRLACREWALGELERAADRTSRGEAFLEAVECLVRSPAILSDAERWAIALALVEHLRGAEPAHRSEASDGSTSERL